MATNGVVDVKPVGSDRYARLYFGNDFVVDSKWPLEVGGTAHARIVDCLRGHRALVLTPPTYDVDVDGTRLILEERGESHG